MSVDISQYLDVIADDKEGEDVIIAIHDAALKLNTDAYKTADIETLLNNIKTKVFGKDVRMDIHETLKRLADDVPDPGGADVAVCSGSIWPIMGGNIYGFSSIEIINGLAEIEE